MNLSNISFLWAFLLAAPPVMAMQKNSVKAAVQVMQHAYKNTQLVNKQNDSIFKPQVATKSIAERDTLPPKLDSRLLKPSWLKKQTRAFKSQTIITAGFGAGLYLGYGYLKEYMPATTKHVTKTVHAGVNNLKSFITKEVVERIELLSKKFDEFRKENNQAHDKTHQDLDQIKKDLNEIKRRI